MESEMNNCSEDHLVKLNSLESLHADPVYNPDLSYYPSFCLSTSFECREQMRRYSGSTDYHSLMHNVQKPVLSANRVEELSFFANKLKLMEWTTGLVPVQTIYASSTTLHDESEIKRLYKLINLKAGNLEEFIIKPVNGSESIGTLKVYLHQGEIKTRFLCLDEESYKRHTSDSVISDYEVFKSWITESVLGVTCGDIDTHLSHIEPGLIIQELFPHDRDERGPTEMKFMTAWGELLFIGCRNSKDVCLGSSGEYLEGDSKVASILLDKFFQPLKDTSLSLARSSTFPNLRCDFFVDIESGRWVLNETETLADCNSYSEYLLKNTGEFYFNGWINKSYIPFDSPLSVSILRDRLNSELIKNTRKKW
tara:strand:- start:449 stop:1546 length:1098 start_codon:yes stop_codon:yes gene_type:complete